MAARTPAGAEPPAPNAAGTNNANSASSQTPPKVALPDAALHLGYTDQYFLTLRSHQVKTFPSEPHARYELFSLSACAITNSVTV